MRSQKKTILSEQDEAQYLTPEALIRRWRGAVKLKTLANWRYYGKGPKYEKFGRQVRYLKSAVLRWERRQAS